MGKDLRGKELGRGISQREDGLYVARYTNKYGSVFKRYCRNYRNLGNGWRMCSIRKSIVTLIFRML